MDSELVQEPTEEVQGSKGTQRFLKLAPVSPLVSCHCVPCEHGGQP